MDNATKAAVGRFVTRAKEVQGGGSEGLALLATELLGKQRTRQAVDTWVKGTADPSGWLLFALARELRIGMDEYLMPPEEYQSMQAQLRALQRQMVTLVVEVNRLRAAQGQPPLDFPEEEEATGE